MLILSIDTSSPTSSVAITRDAELAGLISTRTDEDHSSRIFRQIGLLLSELSLKLNEFDLFAVSTGPGTFTGLRVGLTAVKGWAEAYGRPIAAISGLEALAIQCQAPSAKTIVPVIDARRAQLYFGRYFRDPELMRLRLEDSEQVATPDVFFEDLMRRGETSNSVIVTPQPESIIALQQKFRELHSDAPELAIEEAFGVLAPYLGRVAFGRAREGRLVDSLNLDANYIRRADAEVAAKA